MYHTTGLHKDQILDVVAAVHDHCAQKGVRPWPPSLGLYTAVVVVLGCESFRAKRCPVWVVGGGIGCSLVGGCPAGDDLVAGVRM